MKPASQPACPLLLFEWRTSADAKHLFVVNHGPAPASILECCASAGLGVRTHDLTNAVIPGGGQLFVLSVDRAAQAPSGGRRCTASIDYVPTLPTNARWTRNQWVYHESPFPCAQLAIAMETFTIQANGEVVSGRDIPR